ncbi:methyltransferase domain-containing protein [Mesorhizobium sp.]|uniref:class I SAM-dependent methyltransferase n=1 Tax=Mesorhizobium sp. TaxID=1871066 RepID=UPI000FE66D67|nr:methyltransferase domain-containing protein [Mesorhizobium sp.]RWB06310.1 MAG: methyltransferase domain-containing protein [Mesorhizobium sp.]
MNLIQKFINLNVKLSILFNKLLPAAFSVDGNKDFIHKVLPNYVKLHDILYDVGGGSRPFVSISTKRRLSLTIVGLDISADELSRAPQGAYDRTIAADLCTYTGSGDADVAVCQATLEHVPDTAGAIRGLASTVRPGGCVVIFAPCRNALFARLNLILPEGVKRRLLFALFPAKAEGHDGFKAYYDRCTPREIEALAAANNLVVEERQLYWISSYFMIFFPTFIFWRIWQGVSYLALGKNAAETFMYVLRRPLQTTGGDGASQ